MSDLLPLQRQIVYGPVRSRRLGRSLGINLLPPSQKWCTFDCLYCQYGWTSSPADGREQNGELPGIEEVVQAVETALRKLPEPPDYLTFSGNGEPCLHPDFAAIAAEVQCRRNRMAPKAKTALLSNASCAGDPAIRSAVLSLDRPIMKLDAGSESMFLSFNRPVPGVVYNDIITGLGKMRGITLQSLFAAGPEENLQEKHIADWIEKVKAIHPCDVQIYTLSRPVPSSAIFPASSSDLLDIRNRLSREGIPAEVF